MRNVRASRALVAIVSCGLAAGAALAAPAGTEIAQAATPASTPISVTAVADSTNAELPADFQGFSVESADFARGFLTSTLLAQRLKTLGPEGVIRIGGYSMELVWPAFGPWAATPAPAEAIGGTVDQSDLDKLNTLVDTSGWKVSIGLPLKKIIPASKIRNPSSDPSPAVTMAQVVEEVKAAYTTLGDDLVGVEIGNEYDHVTTLTSAEMWTEMKRYKAAIDAALPEAGIKVIGPSANTTQSNSRLSEFMTAVKQDPNPGATLGEITSHYYPASHCGGSTTSIGALLSTTTYQNVQSKVSGIQSLGGGLQPRLPMTINETNSVSCSGQNGVSNSYAMSLWALDYLMHVGRAGISRLQFHTNTAAICGDFKARTSPDYPISYRYYGAFCAPNQAELDAQRLAASPLYYGLWAFRRVPVGRYLDLTYPSSSLSTLRAYGVQAADGKVTLVLVNLQDPASSASTINALTVTLPGQFASGSAVSLATTDPAGLASVNASAISLGQQSVDGSGAVTGTRLTKSIVVSGSQATINVYPGTARIVTLVPKP